VNTEVILKRGVAGVLLVIGWVLAVLQASLAVQIVIHSLRVLEVYTGLFPKADYRL
jgi:hypothetical protein